MSGWYYADRNRQQHGPVSADELVAHYRHGRIALDSLVWREGLPQWQPLREFSAELGLQAAPADAAPAPPPVPPVPPPAAAPQERLLRTPAPPPAARKGMSGGKIALIVAAALLVPCLAIVGILAAIAIPAYQDYTLRAKVVQAVSESQALKVEVQEFHTSQGRCPSNGEGTFGTPESYANTYVTRATIGEFDDGTCGFELEFGNIGNTGIDGKKLWWDMGSDHTVWHCSSEVDDKWLPTDCRG